VTKLSKKRARGRANKRSKIELLPLPPTFPDRGGSGFQMLSVIEDMDDDDCKIHVRLAEVLDYAESWGEFLAHVARAIARDCDHLDTWKRDDGDLFLAICEGFQEQVAKYTRPTATPAE
jgi:hypothetical protein